MLPENRDYFVEKLITETGEGMTRSHMHEYYEIFYLLDGHRRYLLNHTILDTMPHDVIFVNKGDVHLSQNIGQDQRYVMYLITFNDAFLESMGSAFYADDLIKVFQQKKLHLTDSQHKKFNNILNKAENNIENPNVYAQYIVKADIIRFLIGLNQIAEQSTSPTADEITVYEEHIQEVCQYMFNFYNQQITLEQMAKLAYMSPTYFSKRFKTVTGFGFREYLNNIRIKMATELLMGTQYSINEIASFCGYNNSNYFGDVFKRIVGSSPNKYRKEHYMV